MLHWLRWAPQFVCGPQGLTFSMRYKIGSLTETLKAVDNWSVEESSHTSTSFLGHVLTYCQGDEVSDIGVDLVEILDAFLVSDHRFGAGVSLLQRIQAKERKPDKQACYSQKRDQQFGPNRQPD